LFSTELITEAGTSGYVYMGESHTAGIPNPVVQYLDGKLVRGETRAAGRWYELVHDRFIDPIQQANLRWTQSRQRKIFARGGGGILTLLLIALIIFLSLSRFLQSRADQTVAAAQQDVTSANYLAETAQAAQETSQAAQATQAQAALDVSQYSKDIIAMQAIEASTSTAAAVESTRLALEALLTAQPTSSPTPFGTPTLAGPQNSPTPSPFGVQPTSTTTPENSDIQQLTAVAVQTQLVDLNATQTAAAQPVQGLIIGQSVKGEPIRVYQFGTGNRNVVLVA
jgi:hypothetical protein